MGYRSDVGAVILADNKDKHVFKQFIGRVKLVVPEFFEDWNEKVLGYNETRLTFFVDGIKWYEDYDEVKNFEKVWKLAQDMIGMSGRFVRIGEEDDDIEQDSFGDADTYNYIYLVRHIEMDSIGQRGEPDAQEQTEQAQAPEQTEQA